MGHDRTSNDLAGYFLLRQLPFSFLSEVWVDLAGIG
jgi:hypothetical protein